MSAAMEELVGGLVMTTKHPFTPSDYVDKVRTGQYTFRHHTPTAKRPEWVATFALKPMPGCCGICISTGAQVDPKYRNRGINTLLNLWRIRLARFMGYGLLICTVTAQNEYEIRTLVKNGWVKISEFTNPRTGNVVLTYQYDLTKEDE